MKKLYRNVEFHIIALAIAFIIVLFSLRIPVNVNSQQELKEVKLGYPVHFIIQNFSRYEYDSPPPYRFSFGSPWEDPFQIFFPTLVLNILLIFIIIDIILILLVKAITKKKNGLLNKSHG